jgi:hypothetical protein
MCSVESSLAFFVDGKEWLKISAYLMKSERPKVLLSVAVQSKNDIAKTLITVHILCIYAIYSRIFLVQMSTTEGSVSAY